MSLLRSSHFIRSLAFISRKITLTPRTQTVSLLPTASSCTSHSAPFKFSPSQSYVTQANLAPFSNSSPLDVTIRKLDEDARKIGRVSASEIKNIVSSLNRSNVPTSTQALMLIRCCGSLLPEETPTTRTQIVQNLWQTFENLKIPLDISHYNALLRVYLENEHTFSPTDILTQLESKGIEPNRVTYQRLISKYCQDGNIEGATKILEFMRDKSFPISEGVFNALIYGHSQCKDMASAESILGMMSQAGLEPTPASYTALMCGFAKQGDMENLHRILDKCEASLVNADFLEIIHVLAINGHNEHIEELISKIQPGVGYSADAANHIFHLVNKGRIDTAYRLVKTLGRPTNINGEQLPLGGFLVRHMIRTGQPVDKILAICQRLTDENLHPYAFKLAVQASLDSAQLDTLVALLHDFKARGGEVRAHLFWPLLVREAKANNTAEVLRTLQLAQSEFGVAINQETIRDYVLPYLSPPNQVSSEVFSQLRGVGVSIGTITSAYVGHLLAQQNLKEAARVACAFRARYPKFVIRRLLTPAYLRTQDLASLVTVVKAVGVTNEKDEDEKVDETEDAEPADAVTEEPADVTGEANVSRTDPRFAGNVLVDIYNAIRSQDNHVQHLEMMLDAFVKEGVAVHRSSAEYIQNGLGSAMTANISEALSTLTSEEVESKPLHYSPSQFIPPSERMDPEYTLENIKKLEAQGENASGLKRALLTHYIRQKELDKAVDYMKVLEQDAGFTVSPGLYVLLVGLAAEAENAALVEQYMAVLSEKFPDDKMDASKVLKVAHVYLKQGKDTEMFDLLRKHGRSIEQLNEYPSNAAAWRLLNTAAETSNPETVKKLLDILKSQNYVQPNNVILGPLIKAHILKEDFTGAVETFEWCVTHYRATPWKSELCRHFIQTGDTASLQRITDLSTTIHGEINSLYDLMLCFLDSGRLRQARKILETPGMRMRSDRMKQIIEYFVSNKSVEKIENLLKVTQDLAEFDRSAIYLNLLELHVANNDVDKALGLWTQMQEDNDTPSEEFLSKLATLLKKNNQSVPFSVPKVSVQLPTKDKVAKATLPKRTPESRNADQRLRSLIQAGEANEAYSLYQSNKSDLNVVTRLRLASCMRVSGLKPEACRVLRDISSAEMDAQSPRTIRRNFDQHTSEELDILEEKLSESMKRQITFNTHRMKAAVREGTIKQYLAAVKSDLEAAEGDQEKFDAASQRFPMSGVLVALQNEPALLPEISEMAYKFAKAGSYQSLQALFNYYYMQGLVSEAEQLYESHLAQSGSPLRFRSILYHINKSKNISLAEPLLKILDKMNDPDNNNYIYTKLVGMAVAKENLTEAMSVLNRAAEQGATVSPTVLDRVQALASREGATLPLTLVNRVRARTEQKRDETSSSSDSEDEKKKERN